MSRRRRTSFDTGRSFDSEKDIDDDACECWLTAATKCRTSDVAAKRTSKSDCEATIIFVESEMLAEI